MTTSRRVGLAGMAVLLLAVTACSSSGGSQSSAAPYTCDAACSALASQIATQPPASSQQAPVVTKAKGTDLGNKTTKYNMNLASCADWLATPDPTIRQDIAVFYAAEYGDPQPAADAASVSKVITTVCTSYGDAETPADAAKVSIRTVYGG